MIQGRIKERYIKICQTTIVMSQVYHCNGCGTDLNESDIGVGNIETIETTKGNNPGCYNRVICNCGNELARIPVRSPFRMY